MEVISAHETPARVAKIIDDKHKDVVMEFIAIAGIAAHLNDVVLPGSFWLHL